MRQVLQKRSRRVEGFFYLGSYSNPSFSTRGVGGPGNRSRTTSWSKGLHYKSYARLFSSNFPAHPVCMALKMADEVTTNDCSHKSRAGSDWVCTTGTLEHLFLYLSVSADD